MIETPWYYSPFPSSGDPAELAGSVVPIDVPFVPSQQAIDNVDSIVIYRSAGAPVVRFVPLTPFGAVPNQWSVRIGTRTGTLFTLTSGSGLDVNESTGTITANPTIAQTASLPLDQIVWIELWRVGTGDDNTAPVARRRLDVRRTLT